MRWFNISCGQGTPCNTDEWLDLIAVNDNAVYDRIVAEQATAKIFTSLDHHFGRRPEDAGNGLLSGMTVIEGHATRAGSCQWRVLRQLPPDFSAEQSWRLLRDEQSGAECTDVMLYECKVGARSLLTPIPGCEGHVAYNHTTRVAGSAPPASLLHFAERGPLCFSELYWRGTQAESLLVG